LTIKQTVKELSVSLFFISIISLIGIIGLIYGDINPDNRAYALGFIFGCIGCGTAATIENIYRYKQEVK
jgi:hypothetical protein